jgi:hypothetical protein
VGANHLVQEWLSHWVEGLGTNTELREISVEELVHLQCPGTDDDKLAWRHVRIAYVDHLHAMVLQE